MSVKDAGVAPMRVTGYAYPWDVLEPGFSDRAREIGVDEVAVALSYHTTRAATPWSPERTAVLARHAALYRPVRESVWRDARLRPAEPDWVDGPDSGGDALRALTMPAAAWIVLTHNSRLGNAVPEVAVRNCFGEVYPWALCPSRQEVRDFAATLTAEALADVEVSSVILEACGQLGAVHQCHHEKTDAVWSPAAARLLSVCCCPACAERWPADAGEVRTHLCAEVRRLIASGDLGAVEDSLPSEVRDAVLTARQRSTDELRRGVLDAVGDGVRVALHGSVDPWATGALPGLTPAAAGEVDSVVLPCWQTGAETVRMVGAAREELPSTVDVGVYVTVLPGSVEGFVGELRGAGAGELHLYHLGLAGPGRLSELRAAVKACGK